MFQEEEEDSLEAGMEGLGLEANPAGNLHGGEEEELHREEEETRGLTRSALGPAVGETSTGGCQHNQQVNTFTGETSSEGPDRDSLNSASSRSSGGRRREEESVDYQVESVKDFSILFKTFPHFLKLFHTF